MAHIVLVSVFLFLKQQNPLLHFQCYSSFFIYFIAASPEPYARILRATWDGALLQCEVRGAAPEPRVQWQDGAGNVLHAVKIQNRGGGGRFFISLFTTVTKTDVYRCVVTQEDIRHQTQAETFVPFCGETSLLVVQSSNHVYCTFQQFPVGMQRL